MAGTVTSNLVLYTNADTISTWANVGATISPSLAVDNDVFVQGAGSISWGLKNTGTASIWAPTSTVNLRNKHLYMWLRNDALNRCNPQSGGGTSIVIGTSTANYGVWYVGGLDTWDGAWRCFVLDCNSTPDNRAGTWITANITASAFIGWQFRINTGTTKAVPTTWADAIYYGDGEIFVYGGTPASPATFEDMYSASNATGNKWGIFDKQEGVYIPKGRVSIGSGSANTYFQDQSQIVIFGSDWVSQSLYQFIITGSTTCSLGTSIGTGDDTLGVNAVVINGGQDWKRAFGGSGIGNFTASLKPPIIIDRNIHKLSLYGCIFNSVGNVSFGNLQSTMTGSKLALVDNQFSSTGPIYKNLTGSFSQSLRNKAVTTSGSSAGLFSGSAVIGTGDYTDGVGFAIKLVDTNSIDGDSFTVLNSYGFTSITGSATQSLSVTNHPFTSNTQYLAIYRNKTWNIVNPMWTTPTTRSLFFMDPIGSRVNELYSYDATVIDPLGIPIDSASVFIFQGLQGRTIPNSGSTTINGEFSDNILTNVWTKGVSGSQGPLTQSSYGNLASRIYKYTYTPFLGLLASSQSIVASVALAEDTNITELTASTAISNGSGIRVYNHTPNPSTVIGYNSGSLAFVSGSIVTGSLSGAQGQVVEYLGSVDSGVVFMRNRNGVQFRHNELLQANGVSYASSSISSSVGSFLGNYTYEYDCNTYPLTTVYDYNYAKLAQLPLDTTTLSNYHQVHTWGGTGEKSPLYLGSNGYYTVRNPNISQGWWLSRRGVGTIEYMTDDTGSQYMPPAQYTLGLSGLITGSEVWIFQSGSGLPGSLGTSLASTPSSSADFSYTYTYVSDFYTNIVVNSLAYENVLLTNVLASNSNKTIPIQQRTDRNYSNPAGP